MHLNNVSCLVIGSMNMRENDKYITVLTDSLGKISVNVKGAISKNKGLLASTQLFSFSECTLFENRGIYSMDCAQPICQFFDISNDISKLALASYFVEVVNHVTYSGMDCTDILRLVVTALKFLSDGKYDQHILKASFELKMACMCGFKPEFSQCVRCSSKPQVPLFDICGGVLFCNNCISEFSKKGLIPVSQGVVDATLFVVNSPIHRIFSFSLNQQSLDLMSKISEYYLITKLEHNFKTLDFYKKFSNLTIQ